LTDASVQLTCAQMEAVLAVASQLHRTGALPSFLPEHDSRRAFRGAVKVLQSARIAAVRYLPPSGSVPP
jgi:hypothetical protein